jgi:pimeloyl-ACP methyl ester carboxylesterase
MPLPCQEGRKPGTVQGRVLVAVALLASLALVGGCKHCARRPQWENGECQYDRKIQVSQSGDSYTVQPCEYSCALSKAAELAKTASALEAAGDPASVDFYFEAVCQGWLDLEALGEDIATDDYLHAAGTYHASLAKLLMTAQRYHRWDPTSGLQIFRQGQPLTVQVERYGFTWGAEDFNAFELIGEYRLSKYDKALRSEGLGVPLVVKRVRCEREEFFRNTQPFSATAVLRLRGDVAAACVTGNKDEDRARDFVLEFYNPVHCKRLAATTSRWPLARDLTAPLAWQRVNEPYNPVEQFLNPNTQTSRPQLVMLAPYQCGKIPIVFVHGLLSDPATWMPMRNQLNAQSWFRERYQVWFFRYPTGIPFLVSAAALRRELNAALACCPGAGDDPAAQHMVLIGHSMGGLIAKLQVSDSGNDLWDLAANRPLDDLHADPADRERLREVFFFAPQPFVRRVVMIGTPHRGSTLATRGIGRIGSCLARPTTEADERQRRVVRENPGVFEPWISRRVPNSVDLLEPDSPLLAGMLKLSICPDVRLHSIIGVARTTSCQGPGDGTVSLASASLPCVASEKLVTATHEELHDAATSVIEVERILEQHLCDYDRLLRRSDRLSRRSR